MTHARLLILASLVAGCSVPGAVPVAAAPPSAAAIERPTAGQLVQARQAGMHMSATLLYQGIIPRSKGSGALKDVHYSEGLEMWAAAIPGLFPAYSAHPQSRALPAIWANKPDFDRKAADLGAAAKLVTAAGEAGDLNAYAAATKAVQNACSACHSAYRSD